MTSMNAASRVDALRATVSTSTGPVSPEERVRAIVAAAIEPITLPPTQRFGLHYIRGVDGEVVAFGPEFLYVLDVGLPRLAGVSLDYEVVGRGDPHFPDFAEFKLVSLSGWSANELVFPAWAGRVLVGVQPGTPREEAIAELEEFGTRVTEVVPDLYLVEVTPFHEPESIAAIESGPSFVRYAEPDGVVRIIDFTPGWFVDRLG